MLSYKHAFHVGNHADVVKHLCLIATLDYFKKKNKPFCLYDTHAGAGLYYLDDEQVAKNQEFRTGVEHFQNVKTSDTVLQTYVGLLTHYGEKALLPGSPAIGLDCLRVDDAHVLMELHPTEVQSLKRNLSDPRLSIHARDGFEGVLALSPPKQKRGVVLIDPPYEQQGEYANVSQTAKKLLARWSNACVLIWYPLLGARAGAKSGLSERMIESIRAENQAEMLDVQLHKDSKLKEPGMYGSGVLIINPPWQIDAVLQSSIGQAAELVGACGFCITEV